MRRGNLLVQGIDYREPKGHGTGPIPSIPPCRKIQPSPGRFPRRFAPRNDMEGVVTFYHSTGRHPSDPPWGRATSPQGEASKGSPFGGAVKNLRVLTVRENGVKYRPGHTLSVTPSGCHLSQRERLSAGHAPALLSVYRAWYGLPPALLRSATPLIHAGGEGCSCVVTLYHSPGGLPHHLSALARNDIITIHSQLSTIN